MKKTTLTDAIEQIRELMVRCGAEAPAADSLRQYSSAGGEFIVARTDGAIDGFCAFRLTDKSLFIDAFFTCQEADEDGTATELLHRTLRLRGQREAIALIDHESDAVEWFSEQGFSLSSRTVRRGKLTMVMDERRSEATLNRLEKYFGAR